MKLFSSTFISLALALTGGSTAASIHAQEWNNFGNPLVPDMIADASIQVIDDVFYCYATTDGYGQGLETSGPPVVWKSHDFVHWSFDGTYFPAAVGQLYWAPSKVIHTNGQYYIYPTINGYMYAAVADSPDGPFRLAQGDNVFQHPFTEKATLLKKDKRWGIDAEVFIDDDQQPYIFWQHRHASRLGKDMLTVEQEDNRIETRCTEYSEGPIFFKRKGIYYFLYTIGGDERYEYFYAMSRTSPLGPYETPVADCVCTSNPSKNVYGPGHGCVFEYKGQYYLAFLEYGRRSTNRQTYVNKMEFNPDGTICPVKVDLKGVGALRHCHYGTEIPIQKVTASSYRQPLSIKPNKNPNFHRTEYFAPRFVADGSNGSRWMANDDDPSPSLTIDMGKPRRMGRSEICFVRPTAGHAYALYGSMDARNWTLIANHTEPKAQSPHTDNINAKYRYLKVNLLKGEKGIWKWNIYK